MTKPLSSRDSRFWLAMLTVDRRDFLCRNRPTCFRCDSDQVQLLAVDPRPALWRCRSCRELFRHEPHRVGDER